MSHHCERCAYAHELAGERRAHLVRAPGRALASTRALLGGRTSRRGRGWAEEMRSERPAKPVLARAGALAAVADE
jgi:hypothetical protein